MAGKSLSGLEIAKMIVIYEQILQAASNKSIELTGEMVPCIHPYDRTAQMYDAIDKSLDMSQEDKEYYRRVIAFGEEAWHLVAQRQSKLRGEGIK